MHAEALVADVESKPRDVVGVLLVALHKRYGNTTKTMKDRRTPRGGARNNQRDYREERY